MLIIRVNAVQNVDTLIQKTGIKANMNFVAEHVHIEPMMTELRR